MKFLFTARQNTPQSPNLSVPGRRFLFVAAAVLCCMVLPKSFVRAQAIKLQISVEGSEQTAVNKGQKVTLDGQTITTDVLPPIKINGTWMLSATEVYEQGLGCQYSYQEADQSIQLSNPYTGVNLMLMLNNNQVHVSDSDGERVEKLAASPILAVNQATGESGVMLPANILLELLGFTCQYSSDQEVFEIFTLTILDIDQDVTDYDTNLYHNMLSTVLLEQNKAKTRQQLSLLTLYPINTEDIQIDEQEEEGQLTYTFRNTFNAIGEFQITYSGSFVKKITVNSSGTDTIVQVSYQKKYGSTSLLDEDGVIASFSSASYSLKIKLPDDVKFSQVKHEDEYYDKQFSIYLPGDYGEFYESHPVLANNNIIRSVNVDSDDPEETEIIVSTKQIQGYRLRKKDGYILVDVNHPRKIYSNIVVLDAGHGGKDFGAKKNGTREKNLNYKIIYSLAKKYFDNDTSNIKAYWTRVDDTFISLSERAKFAAKVGADLFVSLHMNSSYNSRANGLEVYYARENNNTIYNGLSSRILARSMHDRLEEDLDASSRGVKHARFYVIRHNTVPAILIELGFLSGNRDYAKLTSESYQKKAAASIYHCVETILEKYPTDH